VCLYRRASDQLHLLPSNPRLASPPTPPNRPPMRHKSDRHYYRRSDRARSPRSPRSPESQQTDSSFSSEVDAGEEMVKALGNLMGTMSGSVKDLMAQADDVGKEVTRELERKISGIDTTQFNCADATSKLPKTFNCGEVVPKADFAMKMDWRQNPNISLSDWTVVVYDGKQSAVYHIHKAQVGHGPRRSGFLALKFDEDENADATDPNTEVYLPSRAAELFPEFLDYIYENTLKLTTRNALALKHLANHFDIRPLYKKIDAFVKGDMNAKTAPTYCTEADAVLDEDVQNEAIKLMAESFGTMDMTVVTKLPPKLFKEVLSSPHLDVESEFLSTKVAQFMRFCESKISDEMLFMLTHPQIMPMISPDEAFFFLNQGLKYPEVLNEGEGASLRNRCIDAVSRNWSTTLAGPIATLKPEAAVGIDAGSLSPECAFNYSSLPAEVKVEIFEAAILAATRDVQKTSNRYF